MFDANNFFDNDIGEIILEQFVEVFLLNESRREYLHAIFIFSMENNFFILRIRNIVLFFKLFANRISVILILAFLRELPRETKLSIE